MMAGRREREHVEGGRGKNKECKGNKEMRKDRGGRKDGQFPPPQFMLTVSFPRFLPFRGKPSCFIIHSHSTERATVQR